MRWEYCTDLFERATVERMARQYALLVDAMAAEPGRPVATLPLMDAVTRERVRVTANPRRDALPRRR